VDDPDEIEINRNQFFIGLKVFRLPAQSAGTAQTLEYSRGPCPAAIGKLPRPSALRSFSSLDLQPHSLVRHREDQQPVIGLIDDDGKIRKLIDGNTKLP